MYAALLRTRPALVTAVASAGVAAAAAIAVTYAPVPAVILILAPVVVAAAVVVLTSSMLAAVLLGVSIPEVQDVTGGHVGLHVAASDVVLILITARLLVETVGASRRLGVAQAMRPVRVAFLQYGWLILALLALHLSGTSAIKSFQRIELFAIPAVAGTFLALKGHHITVLKAYVVAATVLAVAWPFLNTHGLAGQFQKNPTGQLLVGALLVLVGVRDLRRLLACLPFLLIGLVLTASRGAVLALVVGLLVLAAMQHGASRRKVITKIAVIAVLGAAAYPFLPSDISARLTNFSSVPTTAGGYAIDIRYQYDHDAEKIIRAHPWTGIGVGDYLAGTIAAGTLTTDPHEVLLLEAAEGGYIFVLSFVILIMGTVAVLWRFRRVDLAPAAAAVFLATAAHGLVDVYWVRGTPVLGFVLVGLVCGGAWQARESEVHRARSLSAINA